MSPQYQTSEVLKPWSFRKPVEAVAEAEDDNRGGMPREREAVRPILGDEQPPNRQVERAELRRRQRKT